MPRSNCSPMAPLLSSLMTKVTCVGLRAFVGVDSFDQDPDLCFLKRDVILPQTRACFCMSAAATDTWAFAPFAARWHEREP